MLYNYVFESIIKILRAGKTFKLEFETIVIDQEKGLINSGVRYFPMHIEYPVYFIINRIY